MRSTAATPTLVAVALLGACSTCGAQECGLGETWVNATGNAPGHSGPAYDAQECWDCCDTWEEAILTGFCLPDYQSCYDGSDTVDQYNTCLGDAWDPQVCWDCCDTFDEATAEGACLASFRTCYDASDTDADFISCLMPWSPEACWNCCDTWGEALLTGGCLPSYEACYEAEASETLGAFVACLQPATGTCHEGCCPCPVGRYSDDNTDGVCESCSVGTYAPPGSSTCPVCQPGQYDDDVDPSTPCIDCTVGRFSATSVECVPCPAGKISHGGSSSAEDCSNSLSFDLGHGTSNCRAGTYVTRIACYNELLLTVDVVDWGEEMSWNFDDGEDTWYLTAHNGQQMSHLVNLTYQHDHTFNFGDEYGDGWHGGYWTLTNQCGRVIGGGEHDGQVFGFGGSFDFSGSDMCCICSNNEELPCPTDALFVADTCAQCSAGTYSEFAGLASCETCQAGTYAPDGSTSPSDCEACEPSTSDADTDPSTPCAPCAPGRFSADRAVAGPCQNLCPPGAFSPPGSQQMYPPDYVAVCEGEQMLTIKVHITDGAEEIAWGLDDLEAHQYTNDHNGETFFHQLGVSADDEHTFYFTDSESDGWNSGYWELLNHCGVTIAGGAEDGVVFTSGGSFAFMGTDLCCDVACVSCSPGRHDDDSDASTPCVGCAAGTYSDQIGVTGACPNTCPPGTQGPSGSTTAAACEMCAAGQYDNWECDFAQGDLATVDDCVPTATGYVGENCRIVVGTADSQEACVELVLRRVPNANGAMYTSYLAAGSQVDYDEGACVAGIGVSAITGASPVRKSCVFYTDPGTPCRNCPSGTFSSTSATTRICESCPPGVGSYSFPGSDAASDCLVCQPGWVDSDNNPGTPCIPCPPRTYANVTGLLGSCNSCPPGSISSIGSRSIQDCAPTVVANWAPCEPCASIPQEAANEADAFSGSDKAFCKNEVIIKISIKAYGEEMMWQIDEGEEMWYTAASNGEVEFTTVELRADQGEFTFKFADSWGDGWHGGYWQIVNACGGTIAGGPRDGLVDGYGGSVVFSTLDLCCECLDDPDSVLASLGTACMYWIGLFSNDCEADVSNVLDVPGTNVHHVCPVTCGSCSAVALNTTQRTCGLCPVGYQYDAESNTYTDFDECSVSDGGCDPLMGYADQNQQWVVSPCKNTQGSFSCNSCPAGFEQFGKSCKLPMVLGQAAGGSSAEQQSHRLEDVAAVLPKAVLMIRGPAGALDPGSDAEALFLSNIQTDLAVSLGTRPSDIVVSNLQRSGRRQLQDALVALQFDVVFVNATNSPALLAGMTAQLADPNSLLRNAAATAHLLADQQPVISFVCPIGKVRLESEVLCRKCPPPSFANGDGASCTDCPINQEPTERGDACMCSEGFFNATAMRPACFTRDYTGSGMQTVPVCQPCLDLDCIDSCKGTQVVLKPGWASLPSRSSNIMPIFECKEPSACPGGSIGPGNTTACAQGYLGTVCGVCEPDYVLKGGRECTACGTTSAGAVLGIILGIAVLVYLLGRLRAVFNYLTTMQMMAQVLKDGKTVGKMLLATFQILGSVAIVLGVEFPDGFRQFIDAISSFFRFDIGDILAYLALGCISSGGYYSSLATNCLAVLAVVALVVVQYMYRERRDANKEVTEEEHREQAREIFDRIDPDGDGLELDEIALVVRKIDHSASDAQIQTIFNDADTDGGGVISFEEFYAAISVSRDTDAFEKESSSDSRQRKSRKESSEDTFQLDLGGVIQRKLLAERHSDALTKVFLLVFLFYPGLTNKIFDGFNCRTLDQDVSVLDADYTFDCPETRRFRYIVNGILLIVWPIGLPMVLFCWMSASKELIMNEDAETLQKFSFVLSDYRTDCWYWEIVELSRKLILSGLIGLFGRGTIAQSFVATLLSFMFFAVSVHMQPYKERRMNFIKVFSEFQIFGVLLVCIILQTASNGLPLDGPGTMDFYGTFQLCLTIAIFPLILYVLAKQARDLRQGDTDRRADTGDKKPLDFEENPVSQEEGGGGEEEEEAAS